MIAYLATLPAQSDLRNYFKTLTLEAYAECGVNVTELIGFTNFDRYYEGETMDTDPFYIVTDDDVVPCKPTMFAEAQAIMEKYPQIGALGFPTKPRLDVEEVSGYFNGMLEERLWKFDHFGGIRIVRRGVVKKPDERPNYEEGRGGDRIFCDAIRKAGYECVLAPDLWFHHLGEGEGFSTVWKA